MGATTVMDVGFDGTMTVVYTTDPFDIVDGSGEDMVDGGGVVTAWWGVVRVAVESLAHCV